MGGHTLGELGHNLDAGRTNTNDCDALACEVVGVVPLGRVAQLSLKTVKSLDRWPFPVAVHGSARANMLLRDLYLLQDATSVNEHIGLV